MTPRQKQIFWTWFWRITILIVAVLLVAITGNQAQIMIMQTDTLNTLNDMRLEQEDPESEAEPPQEKPVSVHILSLDERDLVCRVVMSEARGEDLQGQMAVSQTILDRSHDWSMTITDVVMQTGVYDCSYQDDISDSVRLAVANVFDGGVRVFDGGTYQFHDKTVTPYWIEGKIKRGSIGNLRFYGGYKE